MHFLFCPECFFKHITKPGHHAFSISPPYLTTSIFTNVGKDMESRSKVKTYGKNRRYINKDIEIWASLDERPCALKPRNIENFNNQERSDLEHIHSKPKKDSLLSWNILLKKGSYKENELLAKRNQNLVPTVIIPASPRDNASKSVVNKKEVVNLPSSVALSGKPANKSKLDPLHRLLQIVAQEDALPFSQFVKSQTFEIQKIGEASYSEVYQASNADDVPVVWKVIPFGEDGQAQYADVLNEVQISQWIKVDGFANLHQVVVVKGTYPSLLLEEWDRYLVQNGSENDRPDSYSSTQLYCVLCLDHSGTDLEHFELRSWRECWSVFYETLKILSLVETRYEFEHRDLHWGNILIRKADRSEEEVSFLLNEISLDDIECVDFPGSQDKADDFDNILQVTLIDFTLARASYSQGIISYNEFNDPDLFNGVDDYQFDIYRLMSRVTKGRWAQFFPITNVLWLHYLIHQLLYKKNLSSPLTETETLMKSRLKQIFRLIDPVKTMQFQQAEDSIRSKSTVTSATSLLNWIRQKY